ncbi:MAG TPA: hypothetical protein VIX81_09960 [Gammaproteobacteria bacterium]
MLAREYRVGTAAAALLALVVQFGAGSAAAAPLWLLAVAIAWLFRETPRSHPGHPLAVVSPVDGHVVAAGNEDDPYRQRPAHGIQLRLGWRGAFTVRSPIEGRLVEVWESARGADEGRRGHACCIRTDEGDEVVLVLLPRLPWALRLRVAVGERIGHGWPYGSMPLGGGARVLVGSRSRTTCAEGERVLAGISVVAELLHD